MPFDMPKEFKRPEPHISFDGKAVDLDTIPDQSIDLKTYQETKIRGNVPGSNALIPKLSNETLLHKLRESILPNCRIEEDHIYDGALVQHYVPELMNRIELLEKQNALLQSYVDFDNARLDYHLHNKNEPGRG